MARGAFTHGSRRPPSRVRISCCSFQRPALDWGGFTRRRKEYQASATTQVKSPLGDVLGNPGRPGMRPATRFSFGEGRDRYSGEIAACEAPMALSVPPGPG